MSSSELRIMRGQDRASSCWRDFSEKRIRNWTKTSYFFFSHSPHDNDCLTNQENTLWILRSHKFCYEVVISLKGGNYWIHLPQTNICRIVCGNFLKQNWWKIAFIGCRLFRLSTLIIIESQCCCTSIEFQDVWFWVLHEGKSSSIPQAKLKQVEFTSCMYVPSWGWTMLTIIMMGATPSMIFILAKKIFRSNASH